MVRCGHVVTGRSLGPAVTGGISGYAKPLAKQWRLIPRSRHRPTTVVWRFIHATYSSNPRDMRGKVGRRCICPGTRSLIGTLAFHCIKHDLRALAPNPAQSEHMAPLLPWAGMRAQDDIDLGIDILFNVKCHFSRVQSSLNGLSFGYLDRWTWVHTMLAEKCLDPLMRLLIFSCIK